MLYQRMIQSVMLLFVAGMTFAACGADGPQTPQDKYCAAKCACNKCTPTESTTCTDDIVNLGEEARAADCKDPYETFLSCLNLDGACTDGAFDESACFNEETDLNSCMRPPAACMTVNDGVCNEPIKGDGTCASGTDVMDCMPPACATMGDGTCDEPEGTNTCPEGTDQLDCPCTKCFAYANDQTMGTLCDASKPMFTALFECACGTCIASCGDAGDICAKGQLSGTCFSCIQSLCSTATMACTQDI